MAHTELSMSLWAPIAAAVLMFFACPATMLAQDKKPESDSSLEGCREVWFKEKGILTESRKKSMFWGLKPDRKLTMPERACLLKASNYLIDKGKEGRDERALFLGDLGHMYGIAALVAVLRDKSDEPKVRLACVEGLSRISDDRVVEPLMEVLDEYEPPGEKNFAIARTAHERLNTITLAHILAPEKWDQTPAGSPARKKLQAEWREWWSKNRDATTPERANIFGPLP